MITDFNAEVIQAVCAGREVSRTKTWGRGAGSSCGSHSDFSVCLKQD